MSLSWSLPDVPAARGQPAILFDLDGTLTDPFVGITRSVQYALEKLGRLAPRAEDLRTYIGPPLQVTFPKLLGNDDAAEAAECLRHYRARYGEVAKFENELTPGIVEALTALSKAGYFLSVATSKLESYARDIIEHFDLMRFFDEVHGSQLDGSNADKGELIGHIMAVEGLRADQTIMIGDRLHDIVGASKNRMRAIGVLWGFGDRAELENAGAAGIAALPGKLPAMIADMLAEQAI
jgi:phosphoglycolate phosphatase